MSERTGKVQTVLGLIEPSELGTTLMHEHIVGDFTPPDRRPEPTPPIRMEDRWQMDYEWVVAPGNVNLTARDVALREMQLLVEEGGRSVVEVTTPGLYLDVEGLKMIAEKTGLHIVCSTGRYTQQFMSLADYGKTADELAKKFIREIEVGHRDTGVKAGIIGEIGCSWPWTDAEKRSVQAGVITQKHTGAPLTIHPGRNADAPFDIIKLVKAEGADLTRTIMCHIERRLFSVDECLKLADYGCVLEFDVFGSEQSRHSQNVDAGGVDLIMASDGNRIMAIRGLIDAGFIDQVVISHDIAQRTRQRAGGGHGYGHIYRNILPMMRRHGFSQDELDAIMVRNPARLLAFV